MLLILRQRLRFIISALVLVLASVFLPLTVLAGAEKCAIIFDNTAGTEAIDVGIQSLAELLLNLDSALAAGKNSITLTALKSDFSRKEKALVEYIERNHVMTSAQLRERIKAVVTELQKSREETEKRKSISEKMQQDNLPGPFHRIEPGKFKRYGANGIDLVETVLTKPFEIMETPVTESVWMAIAFEANLVLGTRFLASTPWKENQEHPMTSIAPEKILEWIEALNDLSRLGDPNLAHIIPGHQPGDKYNLPTAAQWDFVATQRGKNNDPMDLVNHPENLGDYAWYDQNSGKRPNPVRQKKPIIVDGAKIYDLFGNIEEITRDFTPYPDYAKPTDTHYSFEGTDPTNPFTKNSFGMIFTRGGNAYDALPIFLGPIRGFTSTGATSNTRGFRLIRELP